MSVDEFILSTKDRHIRADILHLSPPCQYFSPAHTRSGVQDDENIFAQFGCGELVKKVRPRLITVEQTFGITHGQHQDYFRSLLCQFTDLGYSLRWKIVRLCTWGAAQDRKRLIIIASAPGEKLPPFPPATHSDNPFDNLRPFITIRQAIARVRRDDPLHDIANTQHYFPSRPELDADRLSNTIAAGTGDLYHPSGLRNYTSREYACLQGFPVYHAFLGDRTSIKRQIGNAFPPNAVKVLYKHLKQWLSQQDGLSTPESNAIDGGTGGIDGILAPISVNRRSSVSGFLDGMDVNEDDMERHQTRCWRDVMRGIPEVIDLT